MEPIFNPLLIILLSASTGVLIGWFCGRLTMAADWRAVADIWGRAIESKGQLYRVERVYRRRDEE